MDRSLQELIERNTGIIKVYWLIAFKNFKKPLYIGRLKSTKNHPYALCDRTRAYKFDYPFTATKTISDYCNHYGFNEKDFSVIKVSEETWYPLG